jgi:hypothetical protein
MLPPDEIVAALRIGHDKLRRPRPSRRLVQARVGLPDSELLSAMSSILDSNAQAQQRAESRIAWSPSAITSRPIRALRVFQTNVPVVEPKSTKVTILLKDD